MVRKLEHPHLLVIERSGTSGIEPKWSHPKPTSSRPWIEPSEKRPKIWDQEQLTKNLVTMTEHEMFDINFT
jgi:hypothetical protein